MTDAETLLKEAILDMERLAKHVQECCLTVPDARDLGIGIDVANMKQMIPFPDWARRGREWLDRRETLNAGHNIGHDLGGSYERHQ